MNAKADDVTQLDGIHLGATTRSIITILNQWRADDRVAFDADHGFITRRDIDGLRALTQQDA